MNVFQKILERIHPTTKRTEIIDNTQNPEWAGNLRPMMQEQQSVQEDQPVQRPFEGYRGDVIETALRNQIPLVNHIRHTFGPESDKAMAVLLAENNTLRPDIGNGEGSSAKGLWQFMPDTWNEYGDGRDVNDPYAATDAAKKLYDKRGFQPWEAFYLTQRNGKQLNQTNPGRPMYEEYMQWLKYLDTNPNNKLVKR